MEVRVLIFGPAAALLRADHITIHLGADHSAAALLTAIASNYPALIPTLAGARVAINHSFALPDSPINPADEVALIALVSGG